MTQVRKICPESIDTNHLNLKYLNSPEATMLIKAGSMNLNGSRIIGIGMVKNESDVIEVFVRHNLQFLDALILIDNGSTDGTGEILDELAREGLSVLRLTSPRAAFNQDKRITNLMRSVSLLFSPTKIMVLDADEFIDCSSKSLFRTLTLALAHDVLGFLPFRSYVHTGSNEEPAERNVLRKIRYRRREEDHQWYKVVIPQKIHSNPFSVVETGNHDIIFPVPLGRHYFTGIALAHFPVRSSDQIQKKIIVNWLSVLAMGQRPGGMAWHWEKYYHEFKNSDYSEIDLTYVSNHYSAVKPSDLILSPLESIEMPLEITAKYAKDSPLRAVVDFAEELIQNQQTKAHNQIADTLDPSSGGSDLKWVSNGASSETAVDFPPFQYLFNILRPSSVLEIGVAHRHHLQRFSEMGATRTVTLEYEALKTSDYDPDDQLGGGQESPVSPGERFDLVLCTEVLNEFKEDSLSSLVCGIAMRASRAILISAGGISEPRRDNSSLETLNHWVLEFQKHGWVPLVFQSLAFRACATLMNLRSSPVIFCRPDEAKHFQNTDFSFNDLEHQANIPWRWKAQKPGFYSQPHLGDEISATWM